MESTHSFDASELMGRVPEDTKIVENKTKIEHKMTGVIITRLI